MASTNVEGQVVTSYGDLVVWAGRGVKFRRLHYLYGDEYRLIERAVDLIKRQDCIAEAVRIDATGKNDADVWSELNQYSGGTAKRARLVVVRGAQLIHDFGPLEEWQREMRSVHACFVGDEHEFGPPLWRKARRCSRGHEVDDDNVVVTNQARREVRHCPRCRATRAVLVKYGRMVRCGKPTTDRQKEELVNLVAQAAGASRGTAKELLQRCDWSAGYAIEVMEKIRVMRWPVTQQTIAAMVVRSASGDFVEALRNNDRATAATIAPDIDPEEVPGILAACERWIGTAARGMSAVRAQRTTQEIVRLLDVSWGEADMMRRSAGKYSPAAISRATEALAAADIAYYRDHARVGLLEKLAAEW